MARLQSGFEESGAFAENSQRRRPYRRHALAGGALVGAAIGQGDTMKFFDRLHTSAPFPVRPKADTTSNTGDRLKPVPTPRTANLLDL